MATDLSISLKIRTALAEYLKRDPATILTTQNLRDDLGLDSMAVIELLYRIEEAFDLQIPDQDLVELTNVGHVVRYVEKRLGKTASPAPTKKPAKPSKPKGKKKGKIFVDDRESMMTILAMVNAEKEGQIESKIMKARQMEEIREAMSDRCSSRECAGPAPRLMPGLMITFSPSRSHSRSSSYSRFAARSPVFSRGRGADRCSGTCYAACRSRSNGPKPRRYRSRSRRSSRAGRQASPALRHETA
jgi:acyl carrier protein